MLMLAGYNRRLGWTVVPLLLWAMFAIMAAQAVSGRDEGPGLVSLTLKSGMRWLTLPGELVRVEVSGEELRLGLAVPAAERGTLEQAVPELPPGLSIEYYGREGLDFSELPQVDGEVHVFERAPGRHVALAGKFIVRIEPGQVAVTLRPAGMTPEGLRRWLHEPRRGQGGGWQQGPGQGMGPHQQPGGPSPGRRRPSPPPGPIQQP
jgi:hypothetical protein